MSIHEELIGQGIVSESDEYYNNINKRMKEYFPQKFVSTYRITIVRFSPVSNRLQKSSRNDLTSSVPWL